MKQPKAKPVAGSMAAGLIASICCGGSLVFASAGLGAFYGSLGLWRYVPQVLAAGGLSIVAINYFYYRRVAKHIHFAGSRDILNLRRSMFVSAVLGLAAMVGSFVFLQWLNHAIVNPHRFLARPEFGQALVAGVPNIRLFYALASFSALALLWALPFPHCASGRTEGTATLRWGLRAVVFLATAIVLVVLVVNAIRFGGTAGHAGSESGQHSPGYTPKHQPGTGH